MKNMLDESKLRLIVNKEVRVENLTDRRIASALSRYNSPDTTYQVDLFDSEKIEIVSIPFEEKNYSKYLSELTKFKVNITLRGYTRGLLNSLNRIAKMIYPMNNKFKK